MKEILHMLQQGWTLKTLCLQNKPMNRRVNIVQVPLNEELRAVTFMQTESKVMAIVGWEEKQVIII